MMASLLSEFVALWVALAGGDEPKADQASLLERHFRAWHPTELDVLLATWAARPTDGSGLEQWIEARLWGDASMRNTSKDLVLSIWFGIPYRNGMPTKMSATAMPTEMAEREELWNSGAFWRLIQAHAPGSPEVSYGDWSKPPQGS